jgi:hypothetical protein
MSWEVTIVNATDTQKPLGERDDVIARFAAALPGVMLQPAPGPSPEAIAQMPEVLREHFMQRPRQLNADFDGDDFSIQFYANDQPQIESVGAEVRGDGSPLPALAALCQPNGWTVINHADDKPVDLQATNSPEWEKFRAWRDRAVAAIKAERSTKT